MINKIVKLILYWSLLPLYLIFLFMTAIFCRFKTINSLSPRVVFGSTPIINNSYWSRALNDIGYSSSTFTTDFYPVINERKDWDRILNEDFSFIPLAARPLCAFLDSLCRYDVFIIPFSGFFIGNYPLLWRMQSLFFRLANKKVVLIPFGSDAFIYRRIKSTSLLHGLLMSYPLAARKQLQIQKQVDYWVARADCVIPGSIGPDGFGRWDVILHSALSIDLDCWFQSKRKNNGDGTNGECVTICHAPNHRGFKGTEFVIDAVNHLKQEGLNVELVLLEKVKNSVVKEILSTQVDILVEQLIFTGYTLNGVEGMASGLPVVDNLEDDDYLTPVRRWSYFKECPVVSADPENLVNVLRKLVKNPELRHQLGNAGRAYIEKYHGLDSAQYLFKNIIDYVFDRKESLLNMYHPLSGEYPNRSQKIQHPLVNNRIVD